MDPSSSAPSQAPSASGEETTFQVGRKIGHSNQFTIVGLLGRGGFGEVYLAKEDRAERHVAIKVVRPKFNGDKKMLRRFKGEYILGTRLSHPSLVQMYDLAETPDGVHYIVMEYIQGDNLGARMMKAEDADGQLGVEPALHLGWQISSLFAQLHERQIVHRDLKPGNIMVVPDPTIHGGERYKLLDFGIAKLTDADRAKNLNIDFQTSTGVHLGTLPLMSPESFKEGRTQGPETDVYALGCMLYRCIAGNYPFQADNEYAVITAHIADEPIPLTSEDPSVPPDVADMVHRMLAKDPAKRPRMLEIGVFFARKLGITSAAGVQIVVRGGTQELQAVIGEMATGAITATASGSVPLASVDAQSGQAGQQVTAPHAKPERKRRQTLIAAGLGIGGVVLLVGVLGLRSAGDRRTAQTDNRPGVKSAESSPAAPASAPPLPDLGVAPAASASAVQPLAAPAASASKAADADKKRKKKTKHVGLFQE